MKNIKVYNVKDYIETLTINGEKYTTASDSKLAIIEGSDKVIIVNEEGCGGCYNKDEEYLVGITKCQDAEDRIFIRIDDFYHMNISEMLSKISYEEMPITEFINENWHWKMRVKDNLLEVLSGIGKIGLKPSLYCTKKYVNDNFKTNYC